ncbi:siderophore ABC transporter substrate-binding protein [Halobacillus shinanisalinarum]|uniref:Siderophore ABC transporter substrate-binding protein n=1 Tax=Halobacillus shinanisalinarum TaxID=2932258 RepID=A0ABY4GTX8_9BACI|nr:siderophore ABC transporter substrate-binding protein [Halobacillus shinanisalinarum]UOQ91615.1 siderophore ABC transporter substrate-binding protein [Halobacillus shinanisalinarum]
MKKWLLLMSVAMVLVVLSACGESEETSAAQEGETITVEHELGETEVPKNPENVVVFDYGIVDSLDQLGVDIAAVAKNSLPEYLSQYDSDEYENAGSLKEPDFEKISQMDPGLIIISGRQASVYEQLSEIAPTIHLGVDTTNYMESFEQNMMTLGEIFDKKDAVKEEVASLKAGIEKVNEKASNMDEEALIILANDGKVSAYGPSSRFGIIHDVLGVKPVDDTIEASTHGQSISFEYITKKNPDYLYVIDRGAVVGGESSVKQVVENELVKKTDAYKNDNIIYLDPEYWYLSGGGLQSMSAMVEEIGASLE